MIVKLFSFSYTWWDHFVDNGLKFISFLISNKLVCSFHEACADVSKRHNMAVSDLLIRLQNYIHSQLNNY